MIDMPTRDPISALNIVVEAIDPVKEILCLPLGIAGIDWVSCYFNIDRACVSKH